MAERYMNEPEFRSKVDSARHMKEILLENGVRTEDMTICSNAHCYKWCAKTGDVAKPPFCILCTVKVLQNA
jgi:hypothetical protein